jgi:GntR family transcriptional regulator/MocR family aminotransferase
MTMRNPRDVLWAQLFDLPRQEDLPLQVRLRAIVVREIAAGRLAPGTSLPSSRNLAQLLGLSRNTVTAAYQQLVADGFLESRPRSGISVAHGALALHAVPDAGASAPATALPGSAPDWEGRVIRSMRERPTLAKPEDWRGYPYPFVYGQPDPTLFPVESFRECCSRTLTRAQLTRWTHDFETEDAPELVEQLRLRVLPKRGVFALPEEILVTVGAQQGLHLLAEALLGPSVSVGLEEPGYPHARNAFALRGPQSHPLPVDAEGLVVDNLPRLDYLFVTPSQQSPTTGTLSLARRQALLAQAEAADFVLIEDDYESDNLHDGAPIPALKSLDSGGRVIYLGSLSKSLSPALRLGYIVAPRALIEELRLLRHVVVRHPSAFLQQAYAFYLALGHHESHARRVIQVMRERITAAAESLRRHLPGFSFTVPQGGASIWVRAPHWVDGAALAQTARRHGVLIEPGNVFYVRPPYPCAYFRLRLSSIAVAQIDPGLAALSRAVAELAQVRGVARAVRSR